jgi:hypothetical protein
MRYIEKPGSPANENAMNIKLGPAQIKNKFKWAIRQIFVYGVMPLKPIIQWVLKRTDPGY